MTLHGRVENGVVVSPNGPVPLDGTLVEVTSVHSEEVSPEIEPVSEERRQALPSLIGIWKTENPPDDEEVERIVEEYRMKKYG